MPKHHYTETKMIRDIANIMVTNPGPFTRKMLAEKLSEIYPDKYYQELMNEVSAAIMTDKYCNKRFRVVRTGVWELAEPLDRDQ